MTSSDPVVKTYTICRPHMLKTDVEIYRADHPILWSQTFVSKRHMSWILLSNEPKGPTLAACKTKRLEPGPRALPR